VPTEKHYSTAVFAFLSHPRQNKHSFSPKKQLLKRKKWEEKPVQRPAPLLFSPPSALLLLLCCSFPFPHAAFTAFIAYSQLYAQSCPLNAVLLSEGKCRAHGHLLPLLQNYMIRTVHLYFRSKNCPSPGEPFHFAFAHESETLTGTDVTQPSATDVLL